MASHSFFSTYGKSLISVLLAALSTLYVILNSNGGLDIVGIVQISLAVAGAFLTYVVPLTPRSPWVKTLVNAVMAGLLVLSTVALGDISRSDWVLVILAAVSVVGVQLAPAVSEGITEVGGGSDRVLYVTPENPPV